MKKLFFRALFITIISCIVHNIVAETPATEPQCFIIKNGDEKISWEMKYCQQGKLSITVSKVDPVFKYKNSASTHLDTPFESTQTITYSFLSMYMRSSVSKFKNKAYSDIFSDEDSAAAYKKFSTDVDKALNTAYPPRWFHYLLFL